MCLPGRHWYNLIGFYLHVSLAAGSISWKNVIHNFKELLNALVLPEVFSSFHKKGIFPLIIASDNYTFWFPDGLHYFYLWQNVEEEKYRADKKILCYTNWPLKKLHISMQHQKWNPEMKFSPEFFKQYCLQTASYIVYFYILCFCTSHGFSDLQFVVIIKIYSKLKIIKLESRGRRR